MSTAIQAALTMGILGAGGYAFYQARKGSMNRPTQEPTGATQAVFRYEDAPSTRAAPRRVSFKDALIGGVLGSLVGYVGGEVAERMTTPPIWNTGMTAPPYEHGSTDYKPPYNASIGNRLMGDLMRDFGLTRPQAAGVVGNLDHESGGFDHLQEINPTVAGSRGGYGYAQWTGPRRRNFEAWAASNGLAVSSYAANYGFLRHELTNTGERRVLPRLRRTNSADDAAAVFERGYQRAGIVHLDSRQRRARQYAGGV